MSYKNDPFTYMGVRYRLFKSRGSRWGPAKMHLQYWDKLNKEWMLHCRNAGTSVQGEPVELNPDIPANWCQRCLIAVESIAVARAGRR